MLMLMSWRLVEILKMKFDQYLCLTLWYELNPRVRCAFGNVSYCHLQSFLPQYGAQGCPDWRWFFLSLSADFQTQEGWYQFHFPPEAWTRPVSQTPRSLALGVVVSDELDCHLDLKIIWTIRNLFSMAIPTFRTKQGNKLQSTRTVVEYCSLFGNENVVTPYKKSVSCCTTIAGVCTNWWFLFSKQCNAWPQQRKQSVILSTDQCVNGVDGDYAVEASTCDKVYASVSKMSHPYQLTANMEEIASYIIQK